MVASKPERPRCETSLTSQDRNLVGHCSNSTPIAGWIYSLYSPPPRLPLERARIGNQAFYCHSVIQNQDPRLRGAPSTYECLPSVATRLFLSSSVRSPESAPLPPPLSLRSKSTNVYHDFLFPSPKTRDLISSKLAQAAGPIAESKRLWTW